MGVINDSRAFEAVEALPDVAKEIPAGRRRFLQALISGEGSEEYSSGFCQALRLASALAGEEGVLTATEIELQYLEGLAAQAYLEKKLLADG